MDPQETLFMQTSFHAAEEAGYKISILAEKSVRIFDGVMNGGYGWLGVAGTLTF